VRKDDGAVGVDDVLFGAFGIADGGHLIKVILFRENAIFGWPVFEDPDAVGDVHFDGNVKGHPADTSLGIRYDFTKRHW